MKNLAIIPARSGSKGLSDKNIKNLNGKPLMAYSIEAAQNSKVFDKIVLSTDSVRYASIGKEYGAEVPYLRQEKLSGDHSIIWDTVRDVVTYYEKLGESYDTVTLLQPTSPLRTAEDISKAYELMLEKSADSVVGMCEVDHSPLWMNQISDSLSLDGFIKKEIACAPRQDLPDYYRVNGAIYMIKVEKLKEEFFLYDRESYALIMPKLRSIDIDDEFDFMMAEFILSK